MFEKGRAKTGGKQAGHAERQQITIGTVKATCERLGCDPFRIMANIALDETQPAKLRADCASDLAQYLAPKLKAVDHTFGGSGALTVNASGTELLASRIAGLAAKIGMADGDSGPHE